MRYIELESDRLLFRKFCQEDFPVVFDWLSSLENMKYRSSEPKTEEEAHAYLDWAIQCAEQTECINFRYAVFLKATGELIGSCELAFTDKDPAELAWELHRNYWRKGYGTEIGRILLKLGFETLGLRRIIADCNTNNIGSWRIMENIGMRREGHFVKYYRGNSALHREWQDKYLYAILRDEWMKMNHIERDCTMNIRQMNITDYDEIYALFLSCKGMGLNDLDDSREGIERFLKRNPDTCFVAESMGRIVGCIMVGNDGRRGYIYHTAVHPDYRKQGIGAALVEAGMTALKKIGIHKAALVVFDRNETGNAFWEKMGFTTREDLVYRNRTITEMVRIDT